MKASKEMTAPPKPRSVSLLWRILLSTSISITVLFGALGWFLQEQFSSVAASTLQEEVQASFQAYDSLWNARADQLAKVSLALSLMPQVRMAFGTGDKATIRDAADEVLDRIDPSTLFLVSDPLGDVIASAGTQEALTKAPFVTAASKQFPKQARGLVMLGSRLYQIVVTPVYVASGQGDALLDVLAAGIPVDAGLGAALKASTGGSDFVFLVNGRVAASTLAPSKEQEAPKLAGMREQQIALAGSEYYQFAAPLNDVQGNPIGELRILRAVDSARGRIAQMRRRLVILWIGAVLAGILLTYLLARRLLRPVAALDRAAAEIGKGNYDVRVPVQAGDEIGRLARTFNSMCASIRQGREDLIRQERISTIGRLSTSIIHDLRNPLASIYGGAEMLVDTDLSPEQVRRLASNIYRSSRQVQDLLQELADVTEGRGHAREICRLHEVIAAAYAPVAASAEAHRVRIQIDTPEDIELPLDRSPMERVFQNLISNAVEAMPEGGSISIRAERTDSAIVVSVEDTGPGIPALIATQLFQPFVTAGKKNGLGLGLALSRKTVLSHGGDLWTEDKVGHKTPGGARFVMRLPV
jgi:signal transduction histidine kinase